MNIEKKRREPRRKPGASVWAWLQTEAPGLPPGLSLVFFEEERLVAGFAMEPGRAPVLGVMRYKVTDYSNYITLGNGVK